MQSGFHLLFIVIRNNNGIRPKLLVSMGSFVVGFFCGFGVGQGPPVPATLQPISGSVALCFSEKLCNFLKLSVTNLTRSYIKTI